LRAELPVRLRCWEGSLLLLHTVRFVALAGTVGSFTHARNEVPSENERFIAVVVAVVMMKNFDLFS
jgi:hypothetical protein